MLNWRGWGSKMEMPMNEGQAITSFFYADLLDSETLAEHAQ